MENGSTKIGLRIAAGFLVAITIIIAVFASGITLPNQEEVRNGRLTVLLIDAPIELEALEITITDLEVHLVGDGEAGGEWIDLMPEEGGIAPEPIGPFNLLDLQGENTLTLFDGLLVEGTYNKIRMYVDSAKAYRTYPGDFVDLQVPPEKIDVITKFYLPSATDGYVVVTIDMEPDFAAINENNFRPTLKASIDLRIENTPDESTTEPAE